MVDMQHAPAAPARLGQLCQRMQQCGGIRATTERDT
jgi:hypothetical protein